MDAAYSLQLVSLRNVPDVLDVLRKYKSLRDFLLALMLNIFFFVLLSTKLNLILLLIIRQKKAAWKS